MKRQKESNYNTSQNVQKNSTNRVNRTMNLYKFMYKKFQQLYWRCSLCELFVVGFNKCHETSQY
jgi:hypothetical protein